MEFGCIAKKLGHSFSAEIHSLIGDYDYRLCEVPVDGLDDFMRKRDFKGINVTIPYKKDVIPYLDGMNDVAKRIGSVNTVVNREGRLFGYNTDYFGMKALLKKAGVSVENKTVLVLGTGGTSVTAQVLSKDLGAKEVFVVSRRAGEGVITYSEAAERCRNAEVIINTTPVGMYPENYASPIDIGLFPRLEGVADAVFNPLKTPLVLAAKKRGLNAEGGLYMLVAQAVYASEIFRDVFIDKSEIDRIFGEILKMKQSVALTGMPGSGKSTIGKIVAKMLEREFIDLDAEIVSRVGKPITDIFAEKGEQGFRDIETEVLKDVCRRSGAVIATGGGAILRDENVEALRQNCKVFLLDRDPDWLKPTSDRPTASDREAIKKRYAERQKRYAETADVIIKPTDDADINAEMIIERL